MQLKMNPVTIAAIGILFLGACSSNQTTTPSSPAATSTTGSPATAPANPTASTEPAKTESHGGQGGQVIESGPYHLELLTAKEADGAHIDFFLQKGDNHEPIANAKVTAQVQLPNGNQTALNMKYDAAGKHYYGVLPGTAAGDYKVAILSDINGEKVNGRFSFSR